MKHKIDVYTDGSCKVQDVNRPGAAAVIIVLNDSIIFENVKSFNNTTNNQMELLSPIIALKELERLNFLDEDITIYSDSQYFINGITQWINNWVKRDFANVKNVEYWKILNNYRKYNINYQWVKGHNGNYFNEQVDKLAQNAMRRLCNETEL